MGTINNDPQNKRVILTIDPAEVLNASYFLPAEKPGETPRYAGETIGDAIRRHAWRKLCVYGKKVMGGRKFKFGDVEVVDGKYAVAFYEENPKFPEPPPSP